MKKPKTKPILWLKLVASLGAMVLLSSALSILIARNTIGHNFWQLLSQTDRKLARDIANVAEEFLSQGGSIDDFAQSLGIVRAGTMPMRRSMMGRRSLGLSNLLLTDSQGNVLYHSPDKAMPMDLQRLSPKDGEAIQLGKNVVAIVYSGVMINPKLGPLEESFLKNTTNASIISAIVGLFIALALGSILFFHIMKPLEKLGNASIEVAKGQLDIVLPVKRRDELASIIESFNSMVEALKASEEWKRRIIADAAHELRTPISLIQTRLEMMIDSIYPRDRANLKILYDNSLLLSKLVNDLQELYQAESGALKLTLGSTDLGQLCLQTGRAFEPKCMAQRISLNIVDCEENKYYANVDPARIRSVINNLLQNAVNASEGGSAISIELDYKNALQDNKATIELKIYDEGRGIVEEERANIFERFYRLDPARSRNLGGLGLGLSISKEIIKLHGGSIRAEANPKGRGSVFIIELPSLQKEN